MKALHAVGVACLIVVLAACTSSSHPVASAPPPASASTGAVSSAGALASASGPSTTSNSSAGPSTTSNSRATSSAPTSTARVGGASPPGQPIGPTVSASPSAVSANPCGRVSAAPSYAHVIWIWMENKPYGSVIGSSSAPYENALARECGLATDYRGITHPSLPNYLAATGGSTFGVADDASPAAHPINASSIFGQLTAAGLSWRAYNESMPHTCDLSASGTYAVKHNPAAYFTSIRAACAVDDVALDGNLDRDVAAGTLPSFSFITPNLCNDTHDCSVATGDAWLARWVPRLIAGPNYRAGNTLIVLTWDEGVGAANQIPTVVVAPSVPPATRSGVRFDHYGLLRTTEELLGLPPLGAAAGAPSLRADFHL
jgi:phosphatidylinositol-3-phosphatase